MTKRELFAAMAMQGLLSNPGLLAEQKSISAPPPENWFLTQIAVEAADHLIEALDGKTEKPKE